ncbi:Gfo/Idh/MocA family oxidoreductase [Intrasporangium sp. YIM S08009]|uniref:Gfo/Idh/MocA family oxidoreductase n=1 Tax=Intrasporangium zincisolvens TaxID=3080018 RepID=UPI002B05B595|nr:Gfo/Idh/MocA family oxidoreductase [Intrasporangium sp. YIM S08009]
MSAGVVVRGAGSIGRRHARVLSALGCSVSLWPVRPRGTDSDPDLPGVRVVGDASAPALLAAADLVVVATDTGRHVTDTVAALDAGARRVLLEKPVAPTRADAEALAAHARAGDVWVAAPLRAHAAFRHVLASAGSVSGSTPGSTVSAHAWSQSWLPDWRPDRDHRASYSARADEGGVLRDLVHELDYLSVLLGPPTLLGARLEHDGPLGIEAEQAATLLWSAGRATVTCRLDYVTRPATRGVVLRGPDGCLEWDVPSATVRHTGPDGAVTTRVFDADLDRDATMATQARAALELSPATDAATRHAAGAPATLAEGLATLDLCDRARQLS